MNDRFEPEENRTEEEKAAGQEAESEGNGDPTEEGTRSEKNQKSAGNDRSAEGNGTLAGNDTLSEGNGALAGNDKLSEGNGILAGNDTLSEENGVLSEEKQVPSGEVDARISSYVNEHIRSSGRRRKISAFRVLFFVVLITIVIFFFVDYVLMKRQIVNGWFAQSSQTGGDESGEEASGDEESGNDLTEADPTEPTAGQAAEEATDPDGESDRENQGTGTGEAQGNAGTDENNDGEKSDTDESNAGNGTSLDDGSDENGSGESENGETLVEAVMQYLVSIEVTDSENVASTQANDPQADDIGAENMGADAVEDSHETAGVIVEIGQSAIRILTDYASVEYAETIEITLNGGETVPAQVETANLSTGLAQLIVSVADLSNDTLKEIRMATWGDTAEITAGTTLLLATAANPDGSTGNIAISGDGASASTGNIAISKDEASASTGNIAISGDRASASTGNIAISKDEASASTGNIATSGDRASAPTDNTVTSKGGVISVLAGRTSAETGEEADAEEGTEDDRETRVSLVETSILSVGEKKQPDAVFTTYSFPADAEGCRILIDENGDIVAISTGVADGMGKDTEATEGIETAVAYCADDIKGYIEKMVDGEEIPYVGITGVTVTDEIKESVSLDMPYGVYVWLADTGSPAYQAGILNGDIITAINGVEITTLQEMRDAILELEVGAEASFTLMRQGGSTYREYTIEVTPEAVETIINLEPVN